MNFLVTQEVAISMVLGKNWLKPYAGGSIIICEFSVIKNVLRYDFQNGCQGRVSDNDLL